MKFWFQMIHMYILKFLSQQSQFSLISAHYSMRLFKSLSLFNVWNKLLSSVFVTPKVVCHCLSVFGSR